MKHGLSGNHDQLNNTHENTESSISIATDAIPSDEQNELLHIEFSALSSFKSLFTSLNLSKTKNSVNFSIYKLTKIVILSCNFCIFALSLLARKLSHSSLSFGRITQLMKLLI